MAYTQQQLDALEAAIGDGASVVKYSDKTVEYRSLADMMKIRDMMRADLGLSAAETTFVYPTFSKGLE